ncbi:MAG: hypothetical protein VKJ64_06000, partial [Leptolyngbyaceae bacterium]|nr:hypothetical protein [Leptolyngbyaceae bacterium]
YVPSGQYLTQRGGTFLFDTEGELLYEYGDRGLLGFAENMSNPLCFLDTQPSESSSTLEVVNVDF